MTLQVNHRTDEGRIRNYLSAGAGIFVLDRLEPGRAWGVSAIARYDRVSNKLEDRLRAGGTDLSGSVAYKRATGRIGVT